MQAIDVSRFAATFADAWKRESVSQETPAGSSRIMRYARPISQLEQRKHSAHNRLFSVLRLVEISQLGPATRSQSYSLNATHSRSSLSRVSHVRSAHHPCATSCFSSKRDENRQHVDCGHRCVTTNADQNYKALLMSGSACVAWYFPSKLL